MVFSLAGCNNKGSAREKEKEEEEDSSSEEDDSNSSDEDEDASSSEDDDESSSSDSSTSKSSEETSSSGKGNKGSKRDCEKIEWTSSVKVPKVGDVVPRDDQMGYIDSDGDGVADKESSEAGMCEMHKTGKNCALVTFGFKD